MIVVGSNGEDNCCGPIVERPYFCELLQEIKQMRVENAMLREKLAEAQKEIGELLNVNNNIRSTE
jgi:hypothetical protein